MGGEGGEALPWPVLDPMPAGWLGDTPQVAVPVLRRLTPAQRWAAFRSLRRTAKECMLAGERMRHPELGADALRDRVIARLARGGVLAG